jgi:acyl carrier protein phosphodiesterase
MNLLGHLAAAVSRPDLQIGSVLGDTIKNRDMPGLDPVIINGARFHRACDVFTDSCPAVTRARLRLGPDFRRVSGILLDVYFDHLLARNWDRLIKTSLNLELDLFYQRLAAYTGPLPSAAEQLTRWLETNRPLNAFESLDMVQSTLRSINRRLCAGKFRLEESLPHLLKHHAEIETDFLQFFQPLLGYAEQWQNEPHPKF